MVSDPYEQRMPRDSAEAQRLDRQCDLLIKNIGYLVHPTISGRLPPNARIADIGTGTGIFLQKLAASYPAAILDGYDISAKLFCDKNIIPPNVHLSILDAKQPIPARLQGQYDLVNVAHLSNGLQPGEWTDVAQNLSQLLKQGGAMQWTECNPSSLRQLGMGENAKMTAVFTLSGMLKNFNKKNFEHSWHSLEDNLRAAGLEQVERNVLGSDRVPETHGMMTVNCLDSALQLGRSGKHEGVLYSVDWDDLERRAHEEVKSGCYVRYDIQVVWGFRITPMLKQ